METHAAHPERRLAGALRAFRSGFVVAIVPLVLLKAVLIANAAFGAEPWDDPVKLARLSPMLFGLDVLGAAAMGLLTALLWQLGRVGRIVAALGQALHAFTVVLGAASVIQVGGPVTRQALESFAYQCAGNFDAMWGSIADHLNPLNVSVLGALPLAAFVASLRLGAWLDRRHVALHGAMALFSATAVALTFLLLPLVERGEWRFMARADPHGLQNSAGLTLAASYALPAWRAIEQGGEAAPLDFDWSPIEGEAVPLPPLAPAAPMRQDVLFIVLESIGAPYVDEGPEVMPFLGALAARPGALAFDRHYTSWCMTTNAFFTLFCSELPFPSHKPITEINPGIPCTSLSEALHDAGWHTSFLTSQDLQWDQQLRFFRHRALDRILDKHDMPGHETAWSEGWGIDDRVTVAAALAQLREPSEVPRFLLVNLRSGHHPYLALPEHETQPLPTRRERYLRAIRAADDRVRDLVEGLQAAGRAEQTLIVVTSDHGEGVDGERHGRNVYESSARVPMLILAPQREGPPVRVDEPTSHLDVAPTILGLLGVPVPCTMRGRDLTQPSTRRVAFVGGRPPKFQLGLVDRQWKYVREDTGEDALYDVRADPAELHDRRLEQPALSRVAAERIERLEQTAAANIEDYAARLPARGCVAR